MELVNKMYLCYATPFCKYHGIDIFDLYKDDQGRSIARSIPDITEIDQMIIGSGHPADQKSKKQKNKRSKRNTTPFSLLLEMVS